MTTNKQSLKDIKAQKKALNEKQRKIKAELDEERESQKAYKEKTSKIKGEIKNRKADLRSQIMLIGDTLKDGNPDDIRDLSGYIKESADTLAATLVRYSEIGDSDL